MSYVQDNVLLSDFIQRKTNHQIYLFHYVYALRKWERELNTVDRNPNQNISLTTASKSSVKYWRNQ